DCDDFAPCLRGADLAGRAAGRGVPLLPAHLCAAVPARGQLRPALLSRRGRTRPELQRRPRLPSVSQPAGRRRKTASNPFLLPPSASYPVRPFGRVSLAGPKKTPAGGPNPLPAVGDRSYFSRRTAATHRPLAPRPSRQGRRSCLPELTWRWFPRRPPWRSAPPKMVRPCRFPPLGLPAELPVPDGLPRTPAPWAVLPQELRRIPHGRTSALPGPG